MDRLTGKKTYLTGIAMGLVACAQHVGWVSPGLADTLTNLLLGGGLIFLRKGIAKQ